MVERVRKGLVVLFWLVAFGLPIAFFFAQPGSSLGVGVFGNAYRVGVQLFGEAVFRILFCCAWLAIDILIFWRVVVRRGRIELVEGMAD